MKDILENLHELNSSINTIYSVKSEIDEKNLEMSKIFKSLELQHDELKKNTLSCKEVCRVMGITEPTLIRRRNLGLIPHIRLGNNFYYFTPQPSLENEKGGQNG